MQFCFEKGFQNVEHIFGWLAEGGIFLLQYLICKRFPLLQCFYFDARIRLPVVLVAGICEDASLFRCGMHRILLFRNADGIFLFVPSSLPFICLEIGAEGLWLIAFLSSGKILKANIQGVENFVPG